MAQSSVRPAVKAALLLAGLATLAAAYFGNTPFPSFLSRLADTLLAAAILASAGGFGSRLLRRVLGQRTPPPLEALIFSITLGLGCLSWLMIFLGVSHLWVPWAGWTLVGFGLASGGPFFEILRSVRRAPRPDSIPTELLLPGIAVGVGGVLSFILAWVPITYYDSLVYHFALPGAYLKTGGWVALPGLIYSAFPQTLEMLWTLGLLIGNDTVANLIAWSLSVLLLAAVIAFARRFFDLSVGLMAAMLLALMPAFLLLSSGGYVDVGLALFCFLALYAACLWTVDPSPGWLICSGLCAGWAVGTKYTGALPAGLTAVFLGARLLRGSGKATLRGLLIFGASALVVAGPWLVKNTLFVGNPVFPFFYNWGVKGLNPWANQAAAGYFAGVSEYYSRSLFALPVLLWEAATNGIGFGRGMDVLGDFGWIPLLGFLPTLWLCRNRPHPIAFLGAFAGAFTCFWAISRPVLRFLLPISPLLALLVAYGWVHGVRNQHRYARWTATGLLGAFLLSGLFLFFYTTDVLSCWGVALGLEGRQVYLARRLNYYPAASFMNTHLQPNVAVYVMGDQRGYYYQRHTWITPVFSLNPMTEWANATGSPEALRQQLKEQGLTHLLVNRAEFERLKAAYPALRFNAQGQRNWDGLLSKLLTPLYHDEACDLFAL